MKIVPLCNFVRPDQELDQGIFRMIFWNLDIFHHIFTNTYQIEIFKKLEDIGLIYSIKYHKLI